MIFTSIPGKEQYELAMRIRGVCYSAFSSPNLGITWAMLTLVSGLIYLIYSERKRRICGEIGTTSHDKCNNAIAVDCADL
jgi:hypothetical protein